jgi:hypothetical protein
VDSSPAYRPLVRFCALGAAALLLADAGFQICLAAGAPWGEAAWGGQRVHLPAGLRVASAISALVLLALAIPVLRLAGRRATDTPAGWLRPTMWVVTVFAILNTLGNLASRSAVERTIMSPATVALALMCGVLATVGTRASRV